MQPRPSFDPELLIIIAVGAVAILGLGWIFLTNYRSESPIPPTVEPSATLLDSSPFETRTRTPVPSETLTPEEPPPTATGTSPASYPGPPAETLPSASTLITGSQPAPFTTPTPDQALPAGKYDDTDPNIAYDKNWTALKNSGTANAYKGTLHASNGIGNKASFRFTGDRLRLGYQRGKYFGTVTVLIDDEPYSFHEQAFGLVWYSPELSPGDHFVQIIHDSGESINLDYIEILD